MLTAPPGSEYVAARLHLLSAGLADPVQTSSCSRLGMGVVRGDHAPPSGSLGCSLTPWVFPLLSTWGCSGSSGNQFSCCIALAFRAPARHHRPFPASRVTGQLRRQSLFVSRVIDKMEGVHSLVVLGFLVFAALKVLEVRVFKLLAH